MWTEDNFYEIFENCVKVIFLNAIIYCFEN